MIKTALKTKQILLIVSIVVWILGLTACSHNNADNNVDEDIGKENERENSADETIEEDKATDETQTIQKAIEITLLNNYSEGLAWVWCNEAETANYFYGCIDKDGEMQFYIDGDDWDLYQGIETEFLNGYAHIWTKDAHIVVNTLGDIVSKYMLDKENSVKVFGEGYVCTEKYTSGFEDTHYTYTIYDPEGKKLQEFEYGSEPLSGAGYFGKGVFGFSLQNENGEVIQKFYCADSDKWVDSAIGDNIWFYDDIAVVGIGYYDPDETGYRARLRLMDISGNFTEVPLSGELGWDLSNSSVYVSEGYCILECGSYLVSYNLSTKEFKKMDNEYADNLQADRLPDTLILQNGRIALPLEGSDGENYVAVFDKDWKPLCEPIMVEFGFSLSEDRLIVRELNDTIIFNEQWEEVFSHENREGKIAEYKEGMAIMTSDGGTHLGYIDKDGNTLFDENIDISSAKQIMPD